MNFKIALSVFAVMAIFAKSANSLQCYYCNSVDSRNSCEQGENYLAFTCSPTEKYCTKIVLGGGEMTRGCAETGEVGCKGEGSANIHCICEGHLCNSAQGIANKVLLWTTLSVVVGFLLN